MTPTARRIVIDTNTFVSAALLSGSVPDQAVEKVLKVDRLLCSSETLSELEEVMLRSKFDRYRNLDFRKAFLTGIRLAAASISVTTVVAACRHPKDDKFLELAIDGRADLIVTGDNDLLVLNPFRGIEIVTPSAYLSR